MVRVGVWDGAEIAGVGQRLLPRVVRRELAARLPDLELRAWSAAPGHGMSDPSGDASSPLGAWSASRIDELVAAIDLVVIAGTLPPDLPFVVEGPGSVHEPDIPAAWHRVRLDEDPDGRLSERLGAALARRAYVSVDDEPSAERLRALVDREIVVVPGHELLADRLWRADEPEDRTTRLRAAGVLPEADVLVVQGGDAWLPQVETLATEVGAICADRGLVPLLVASAPGDARSLDALGGRLPSAWRLPDGLDLDDLCAVVGWSAGAIVGALDLASVAAAFGRPAVVVTPEDVEGIAERFAQVDPAATSARIGDDRARLDAHFDRIAALAANLEPVGAQERKVRSLAARLAAQEATAAARERELEEMNTDLSRRVTAGDVRFVGLWKKIHDCDRHYAWQFDRAEAAEELVTNLRAEVEWLRAHQKPVPLPRRVYLWIRRGIALTLRRLGLRRSEPAVGEPSSEEPPAEEPRAEEAPEPSGDPPVDTSP